MFQGVSELPCLFTFDTWSMWVSHALSRRAYNPLWSFDPLLYPDMADGRMSPMVA